MLLCSKKVSMTIFWRSQNGILKGSNEYQIESYESVSTSNTQIMIGEGSVTNSLLPTLFFTEQSHVPRLKSIPQLLFNVTKFTVT